MSSPLGLFAFIPPHFTFRARAGQLAARRLPWFAPPGSSQLLSRWFPSTSAPSPGGEGKRLCQEGSAVPVGFPEIYGEAEHANPHATRIVAAGK